MLKKHILLKISSVVLAAVVLTYLGIAAVGARKAMDIPRLPLAYEAGELGVPCEDVSFKTRGDGITLKGWFLPGRNGQAVIMVHGGYQTRIDENADTPGLSRALVERGYGVLLFDLRGRGESEGEGISLSNIDQDIGGAVDYLQGRGFGTKDICIMGFSSGAVMTCIYGSRNEIGSLILDGCFIDGPTMVVRQALYINVPEWVAHFFMPAGIFFCRVFYGYERVDAIDVIHLVKAPILFIQEEKDIFTMIGETERLLEASANPANEIWEAAGAEHSQAFSILPEEYVDAIDNFLKKVHQP